MKLTFTTEEHRLALLTDILIACDCRLLSADLVGSEYVIECEVPEKRLSKFRIAATDFVKFTGVA